jgi:hypothetical protein
MSSGPSALKKMQRLIVRRSLSPAYYYFLQTFAEANRLEVVIDRRVTDRRLVRSRTFRERRLADRRGLPPSTWIEGDFVVVRVHDGA